jgi:hypothetical protein
MDDRKNRRGGFYWLSGEPFVSVTNVLGIIDKPQLRYWYGREVYLAMVKDPTLGEKEALSAPYKTSDKALTRGSTVHSIVESYKTTGIILEDVVEPYKGYARAFKQWVSDFDIRVQEHEKTVVNKAHRYAGTLDLLVSNRDKETILVDVKTGKGIYDEAWLQTSAYWHGDDIKADKIAVVLLGEDGTYKFEYGKDKFDYFLAAKKLWEWQNTEKLYKVGYFK